MREGLFCGLARRDLGGKTLPYNFLPLAFFSRLENEIFVCFHGVTAISNHLGVSIRIGWARGGLRGAFDWVRAGDHRDFLAHRNAGKRRRVWDESRKYVRVRCGCIWVEEARHRAHHKSH